MRFETERLILRPWEESDAENLYKYAKDPEVGPIAGWPVHTSVENSLEIIRSVLSAEDTYAVCLKEDNKAIGSIGLIPPAQSHTQAIESEIEIGYWIGVPFWGNGYIPEAVKELQKYAFCQLGCTAMWCGYYEGNEKSKRCQEKCGFTYHHTEENKPCIPCGDLRTEHFTLMTKAQWSHDMDCMICGKKLVYTGKSHEKTCDICGKSFVSDVTCEAGHYVCDSCHSYQAAAPVINLLAKSTETDPLQLFEKATRMAQVHMHGPEHHVIVPLSMLTACRNIGLEFDYPEAVKESYLRGSQVPGGTCGYWGVCGAAASAGIFASVFLGSNPLNREMWHIPQTLVSEVLAEIAKVEGPRCCKRTGRIALTKATEFINERFQVDIQISPVACADCGRNRECIGTRCPYFPTNVIS